MVLTVHSEGAIIGHAAFNQLSNESRLQAKKKLNWLGVAPASMVMQNMGRRTANGLSKGDPFMPVFNNLFNLTFKPQDTLKALFNCNITHLHRHPQASHWNDHSHNSFTYDEFCQEEYKKIRKAHENSY